MSPSDPVPGAPPIPPTPPSTPTLLPNAQDKDPGYRLTVAQARQALADAALMHDMFAVSPRPLRLDELARWSEQNLSRGSSAAAPDRMIAALVILHRCQVLVPGELWPYPARPVR